jgi:hypothetical protein
MNKQTKKHNPGIDYLHSASRLLTLQSASFIMFSWISTEFGLPLILTQVAGKRRKY